MQLKNTGGAMSDDPYIVFEDELQMVHWRDDASGGMTVTFRVASPEYDAHPFKRFAVGARLFARMIEIGDDEQPVNQEQRERIRAAMAERETKGGRLARDAGILCNNPAYQRFVVELMLHSSPADKRTTAASMPTVLVNALKENKVLDDPRMAGELAKWHVYRLCGIKSRRELDHRQDAANRYEQFILKPWIEHKRAA